MSFRDTFWELLAVTGSLLGSLEWIQEPPDQLKICPPVHPFASFFFVEPIFDQENGILVEETRKKTSEKVILR